MFDAIRQLISDNRIRQALDAADELPAKRFPASKLLNLKRRWKKLEDQRMSDTEHESILSVEENKVVDDFISLLDNAESDDLVENPDDTTTTTSHTPPKKNGKVPLSIWLVGGLIVACGIFWLASPKQSKSQQLIPNKELTPDQVKETNPTTPTTTPATGPKKQPTNKSTAENTTIGLEKAERQAELASGNTAANTPIAVAIYMERKAPTTYHSLLSKEYATKLRQAGYAQTSAALLTDAFHQSPIRDELIRLSKPGKGKELTAPPAPLLLLLDFRNYGPTRKPTGRICIYDTRLKKGYTQSIQSNAINTDDLVGPELGKWLKEYFAYIRKQWDADWPVLEETN